MALTINSDVRAAALEIVRENREADPDLKEVYLFPDEEEIRLVYLDPNTMPHRGDNWITPFYFGRDVKGGLPYRSAIALIRPEEFDSLLPPQAWGTWRDAEALKE